MLVAKENPGTTSGSRATRPRIRWYWSILGSVDADIGFPLRMGNTSGLSPPSVRAACRISSVSWQSGTRCPRFAVIRSAEVVRRVDLGPRGESDFVRPRGRQHQKLERQLDGGLRRARRRHGLNGRRQVLVLQRPHVLHDVVLRTEHRQDPVARIVVSRVHRDRPLQDRPDALPLGAGGLRLDVPGRGEDLDYGGD